MDSMVLSDYLSRTVLHRKLNDRLMKRSRCVLGAQGYVAPCRGRRASRKYVGTQENSCSEEGSQVDSLACYVASAREREFQNR